MILKILIFQPTQDYILKENISMGGAWKSCKHLTIKIQFHMATGVLCNVKTPTITSVAYLHFYKFSYSHANFKAYKLAYRPWN